MRKTHKPEETILVVCNFAPVQHDNYQVGVPFHGKYKEILNSESVVYGGCGVGNPRVKTSKAEECNGMDESITIQLAPLGVQIFTCTPVKEVKKAAEPEKSKKATESKKEKTTKGTAAGKKTKASTTTTVTER